MTTVASPPLIDQTRPELERQPTLVISVARE